MSRRAIIIASVGLAVIAIVAFLVLRDRGGDPEVTTVTRGTIDVTIQTVGTIQAPEASIVRSRIAGVIETFGAEVGDVVEAGDVLALLDQQPLERAVRDAESQLTQAEFALQLAELRASQAPENEERRFEVLSAADRVERAERAVADAEEQRSRGVIVAPHGGRVIEVTVRVGDAIGANQPVFRIAQATDLRLVADVDELDLPNVAVGASARFRLDAYPATELEGNVRATSPVARQQGGATVFATTIEFERPDALDVRPGMNADVTIVTDARDNVLLISERALRTVGSRSFVMVDDGGTLVEREVTLGYRGQGQVEIVAGLNEGDLVALR